MTMTVHVDVVEREEQIFSGVAEVVVVPGEMARTGHLSAPHRADDAHQARRVRIKSRIRKREC